VKRASWPQRVGTNWGFGALLAILFLTFLDNTVASAVLTSVQAQLQAGVTELQWVVGSYALAFASLMLLSGSLADSFGRKRVMLIGVGIFCAGSIVAAVAASTTVLIVGRIVMGVGAAASEPGTLSMIRHLFPEPRRRARALGAWAAVSGLALAMGPVLGGVLVGLWSWRAVFWFNLIFGALALVVAVLALPESVNESPRSLDTGGFVLGALALASATFATIYGESAGYRSASVVTLYVVSGLFLVTFTWVERHVREPMLNLNFFRNRAFSGSVVIAFTSYFSIFSIFFFVALYLEFVASVSAYGLALDFLPLLGGMVAASLFSGRWVERVGSRIPLTVGCLLAAAGVALTNVAISPGADLTRLGWTMGLAGVGFGIIIVPINATVLSSLPASYSGVAASTINTSRELGAVTGVAILGSIVNAQLTVQLTKRLVEIGIPPAYRNQIINAVTNGAVNAQAKAFSSQSNAAIQTIINKVVTAAYTAFGHGLDVALTLAAVMLVTSALVAWVTGTREPQGDIVGNRGYLPTT
jgi:EmrB/QacA subfamily drug resistance transporter